jgi:hypothetical protein
MTMITVPLSALIGVVMGVVTSGLVVAVENDDTKAYLIQTVIITLLFVLYGCGLEALGKAGLEALVKVGGA